MSLLFDVFCSWHDREGKVSSTREILDWIEQRDRDLTVNIEKIPFPEDGFWFYDPADGRIRNRNNSFFQLSGYREVQDGEVVCEQPVILQQEIGYLGDPRPEDRRHPSFF